MKFTHLNLMVENVQETKAFFEKYFNMKCFVDAGEKFVALTDEDDFMFNLVHDEDVEYPATFHIGFEQSSVEEVDAMYEELEANGFEPDEPLYTHDSYTFYFMSPGKFTVEVYHNVDEKTKLKQPDYFKEDKDEKENIR